MKKGLIIIILTAVGVITAIGLVIAAIIEIIEAIIALVVWGVLIGVGYLWMKSKTSD